MHGRQPPRQPGQPARLPRRAPGELDRDQRAGAARRGGRPPPHRHRRPRHRVDAHPSRHRRRPPAGAVVQVLFADGPGRPRRRRRHRRRPRRRSSWWRPSRPRRWPIPAGPGRRHPPLARELAAADRAVWYGRIGTCNQEFGTLASWLVDVVNIVTGNFDRPGGLMFGNPVAPIGSPRCAPTTPNIHRWTSRVRGAPEVLGQVPVSCLAEEIATPGEGQIKALVTICRQPGDLGARARPARRGPADARVHDLRRQLPSTRPPATPTSSCPATRRSSSPTTTR
jgi:hypothetical protein